MVIDMWTEQTFIFQYRRTQAHHVGELEKLSKTLCFIHKKSKTYRVSQKNVLIEQNHKQNWVLWG